MIGDQLFDSEPIGNIFCLHAAIFEISKEHFIIKPLACRGTDISIKIYQLLLLFSIISPWLDTKQLTIIFLQLVHLFFEWHYNTILFKEFLASKYAVN